MQFRQNYSNQLDRIMATKAELKNYFALWLMLSKSVELADGSLLTSESVGGVRDEFGFTEKFTQAFNKLYNSANNQIYLSGTNYSLEELKKEVWEGGYCALCRMPVMLKIGAINDVECICGDSTSSLNATVPKPRIPASDETTCRLLQLINKLGGETL